MPLPLLPFLIKGGVVVGKILLTKAGAAKTAAVVTKSAVTHLGAAKTASIVATGLVCTGGVMWTVENIERVHKTYEHFSAGNYRAAVDELTRVAISVKTVGASDYAGDLKAWLASGKPMDDTFVQLIKDGKALADEALATAEFTEET